MARLEPLIQRHPLLLGARHELYWSLLSANAGNEARPLSKELAKVLVQSRRSRVSRQGRDVVFWIESPRDIVMDAVLPVVDQVRQLGLSTFLMLTRDASRVLGLAAEDVAVLRVPYRLGSLWRNRAVFAELRATVPEDLPEGRWPLFNVIHRRVESLAGEIERVLRRLRPRAVVVGRDQQTVAATVCVVARQLGIPSITMEHGMIGPGDVPIVGDRHVVWGSAPKDRIVESGTDPNRVVVLGSPRHDSMTANSGSAREGFRRDLELNDQLVFTFFSNSHAVRVLGEASLNASVAWIEHAARALAGKVTVLVKLHPDEDGTLYEGAQSLRVLDRSYDLPNVLAGSDVIGSICSTTLLEALLFRRPALQFLADDWPETADFWRRGLTFRVDSSDRLTALLAELCQPVCYSRRSDELASHVDTVFANVGRSAEAIANYVAATADRSSASEV